MAHPLESIDSSEYQYPKPLIDLHGKPLIEYVIDRISSVNNIDKIFFIVNEDTCLKYHLDNTILLLCPKAEIIYLKKTTSGAVCSVLMGIDKIPHKDKCIIINADQIILEDVNTIIENIVHKNADAAVITFNSVHPRWSYVLLENNMAVQFAEKNPISKNAIAGFYYFKSFELFITNAFKTIRDDDQLNGNFYISSVLNQFILANLKVTNFSIAPSNYLSLYSAQKIKEFETYLTKQNL